MVRSENANEELADCLAAPVAGSSKESRKRSREGCSGSGWQHLSSEIGLEADRGDVCDTPIS
jgi:hypothetical protein